MSKNNLINKVYGDGFQDGHEQGLKDGEMRRK